MQVSACVRGCPLCGCCVTLLASRSHETDVGLLVRGRVGGCGTRGVIPCVCCVLQCTPNITILADIGFGDSAGVLMQNYLTEPG